MHKLFSNLRGFLNFEFNSSGNISGYGAGYAYGDGCVPRYDRGCGDSEGFVDDGDGFGCSFVICGGGEGGSYQDIFSIEDSNA